MGVKGLFQILNEQMGEGGVLRTSSKRNRILTVFLDPFQTSDRNTRMKSLACELLRLKITLIELKRKKRQYKFSKYH